eukprot:1354116-Prymnesium_polylepis.1
MPDYSPILEYVANGLHKSGRSVRFFTSRAASTCDNAILSYDAGRWGTDGALHSRGQTLPLSARSRLKRARSINVLRLIAERARSQDFVVVKLDIESHEYALVPCLASVPWLSGLVDQLFVEEHALQATPDEAASLRHAYARMRQRGTHINSAWP